MMRGRDKRHQRREDGRVLQGEKEGATWDSVGVVRGKQKLVKCSLQQTFVSRILERVSGIRS